jgi:hypothetical protein
MDDTPDIPDDRDAGLPREDDLAELDRLTDALTPDDIARAVQAAHDDVAATLPGETGELLPVRLVGGPEDGLTLHIATARDLAGPREKLGTWMALTGGWPDDVPDGSVPRAVYEPDPAPAPPDVWHYRGLTCI